MNWKRMKRVLATSLAVMLALPPNIYGGPTKVQAEQARGVVTQFYSIDYLNDEEYLVGSTEDYIRETLPDQLYVSYSDVQESLQNLDADDESSVTVDESAAEETSEGDLTEETSVEEEIEEEPVEENTAEESAIEEVPEEETSMEEKPAEEQPEEILEEVLPEENLQEPEPEKSEEPAELNPAETVSSAIGFLKSMLPQPLVVCAAGVNELSYGTHDKEVNVTWNLKYCGDSYECTPVITESWLTVPDTVTVPTVKVKLVNAQVSLDKSDFTMFTENYGDNWAQIKNNVRYDYDAIRFVSSDENVVRIVSESSGSVYAYQPGVATISMKYNDTILTSYQITVVKPSDCYTVNKDNQWSKDKFYITAKEGFSLKSYDGVFQKGDQLEVNVKEGEYKRSFWFYVVNKATGEESHSETIDCKIDKSAPTGTIYANGSYWSRIVLTTDSDSQPVRELEDPWVWISAYDDGYEGSRVTIQYHIFDDFKASDAEGIEQAVAADGGWIGYTEDENISLGAMKYNVIYAKLIDNVGNVSYLSSGKIAVLQEADNISVSGIKIQSYTGKAIRPKVMVKDATTGKKLKEGKQYSVSYEDNVDSGIGAVVIRGVDGSGYEGTKKAYFFIAAQNIAKKVQTKVVGKKFSYTGEAITPSVNVKFGKITLVEGRDYELSYANNVSQGTAQIYVKGLGNFTGTKVIKFKISGPQIKDAEVSLTADSVVYSGAGCYPSINVVYHGKTCQEGVDYTVTYPKSLKAGKNAIRLKGIGNLSGSMTVNFTVTKAPIDQAEVTMQDTWQLTGGKLNIVPSSVIVNGSALNGKKDYTIKYRSTTTGQITNTIKTAGSYQMLIMGKGCYQGTKTVDFTVK